jgi:hypothetical protein
MSPWVRKDRKTGGKKLEGQVSQVLLCKVGFSSVLPIESRREVAGTRNIHLGVLGIRPPPSLLFNFAACATKWFKISEWIYSL